MKRVRIMGLCLAAVFVVGACAATVASAESLPALYECAKVKVKGTGIWNKGCKVEGKHNIELKENEYEIKEGWGKGKVFKGASIKGTKPSLTIPNFATVTCGSFKDEARFTGEKTVAGLRATFKTCEIVSTKCNSKGALVGEIKTSLLKGVIGYIDAGKHEVGVKLSVENPLTEPYDAVFECGPVGGNEFKHLRVSGGVIGKATPINVFSKVAKVAFVEENNKQIPESFEGEAEESLGTEIGTTFGVAGEEPSSWGFGAFPSTQTAEAENKGEELMLKA